MTAWVSPSWRRSEVVRRMGHHLTRKNETRAALVGWAVALLCAPLVLLLIEVVRGAVHELTSVRANVMQAELQTLRSDALQRAKGLEVVLNQHSLSGQPLSDMLNESPAADYWAEIKLQPPRLYAAVVDESGTIVGHTEAANVGQRLNRGWYDQRLAEHGPNVTLTRHSALGGDRAAYDVSVLLTSDSGHSEYHEGVDAAWLDAQVGASQRSVLARWGAVLALVLAVNGGAVWALVYLAQCQRGLASELTSQSQQRAKELSQIGSGLAHEVRNPLHALRINLHTLRRALGGRSSLPPDQLVATIDESDAAIERLDELMRDFLQYSDRSAGKIAQIDLVHEVQTTLRLLAEDFRRDQIEVRENLPDEPLAIAADPHRCKQSLLNLLTFAQHRAGKSGTICVNVERCDGGVELSVGNSGPSLAERQREQLFEPFQSPVGSGSGLGLALVQAFAEEAGGRATCDSEGRTHGLVRLWIPLANSSTRPPKEATHDEKA